MIKRVDKRLQAVQCLTGNKIKIIACITMLIDHFSKIFLESIMNDKLFPLYLAGGMSTEQFYGIDAFQKNILLLVLSSTYIASLWCIASVQIRNALALPGHFSK